MALQDGVCFIYLIGIRFGCNILAQFVESFSPEGKHAPGPTGLTTTALTTAGEVKSLLCFGLRPATLVSLRKTLLSRPKFL